MELSMRVCGICGCEPGAIAFQGYSLLVQIRHRVLEPL